MELKKYKDKFSEYNYYEKDGEEVLHGLFKEYYEDGKIRIEYNYKNDEFNGLCKRYDEDGELESEYNYKDGKRHGLFKYYEDGKIRAEYNFKNNIQIN